VAKPLVILARSILFSAGLTAASCATPNPSAPDSYFIRTEADVYRARATESAVTLTVVARFTNTTRDTLVLHPCAQHRPYPLAVSLQRNEGGTWRTVLAPWCTLALMFSPPRLLPGQTRIDTVRLQGSRHPNTLPGFSAGPIAGSYRLAYSQVYRKWYPRNPPPGARNRLGEPLPDSLLVSNMFRVVE
jgi:hypothetical protein